MKTGARVFDLRALQAVVYAKQSVFVPTSPAWRKCRPAAFMIHQPAVVLLRLFEAGMYIYIPTKQKEKK